MINSDVILKGTNIVRTFGYGKTKVAAVNDVSFDLHRGEVISIAGESGSGKTTFAKIIMGLLRENMGQLYYKGNVRDLKTHRSRKEYWKNVQAIFQDPFSSFNQFYSVETLLRNCIKLKGMKLTGELEIEKMKEACGFVNLKYEELYNKYPFELSGGQMQRLMIVRIFMMHPEILIADEPTSMIDACSRSTILDIC